MLASDLAVQGRRQTAVAIRRKRTSDLLKVPAMVCLFDLLYCPSIGTLSTGSQVHRTEARIGFHTAPFALKKPSQVPKGASYITAARSLVVLSYPIRSFRRRRGGSKMRPEITPSSFFSPREYETTQAQSDDEESHVRTTHAYDHLARHQARSPGQEGRGGSVRGGGDHTQLSHFPS